MLPNSILADFPKSTDERSRTLHFRLQRPQSYSPKGIGAAWLEMQQKIREILVGMRRFRCAGRRNRHLLLPDA
jgi:hypothetical protein